MADKQGISMTRVRFSADRPCPICGGYDRMPRGRGQRCYGFLSDDGRWANCTRAEYAGGLPMQTSDTYSHLLDGECRCGDMHGHTIALHTPDVVPDAVLLAEGQVPVGRTGRRTAAPRAQEVRDGEPARRR